MLRGNVSTPIYVQCKKKWLIKVLQQNFCCLDFMFISSDLYIRLEQSWFDDQKMKIQHKKNLLKFASSDSDYFCTVFWQELQFLTGATVSSQLFPSSLQRICFVESRLAFSSSTVSTYRRAATPYVCPDCIHRNDRIAFSTWAPGMVWESSKTDE